MGRVFAESRPWSPWAKIPMTRFVFEQCVEVRRVFRVDRGGDFSECSHVRTGYWALYQGRFRRAFPDFGSQFPLGNECGLWGLTSSIAVIIARIMSSYLSDISAIPSRAREGSSSTYRLCEGIFSTPIVLRSPSPLGGADRLAAIARHDRPGAGRLDAGPTGRSAASAATLSRSATHGFADFSPQPFVAKANVECLRPGQGFFLILEPLASICTRLRSSRAPSCAAMMASTLIVSTVLPPLRRRSHRFSDNRHPPQ